MCAGLNSDGDPSDDPGFGPMHVSRFGCSSRCTYTHTHTHTHTHTQTTKHLLRADEPNLATSLLEVPWTIIC